MESKLADHGMMDVLELNSTYIPHWESGRWLHAYFMCTNICCWTGNWVITRETLRSQVLHQGMCRLDDEIPINPSLASIVTPLFFVCYYPSPFKVNKPYRMYQLGMAASGRPSRLNHFFFFSSICKSCRPVCVSHGDVSLWNTCLESIITRKICYITIKIGRYYIENMWELAVIRLNIYNFLAIGHLFIGQVLQPPRRRPNW